MPATLKSTLLSAYEPLPGHPDELIDASGQVNTTWTYLAKALDTLGVDGLHQRQKHLRRILRERGVTYNVYSDPAGLERSWDLDPVPMLIGSDEWARVEHGLQQRADLFNLILKDIYGPQELLARGLLPAELVHAHTGFLRPCHPYRTGLNHPLTLYAADLARRPDGTIYVLEDRTQAPSGAGYALENRVVMNRAMPSLLRESQVHRLALFFQNLRATLSALAPPRGQDEAHVVVLTPGSRNETYFEHAFLASYLGYTLVEGGDLTVRDGRVWLRSMDRLEPVDVILRRLDDDYCDALELRPESLLGVPGLTEVVRQGSVAVANPLGAGVLENPALNAFLPGIAQHLLGQELELPAPPTWWCGDPDSREYVLSKLDSLVIRPIDQRSGARTIVPGTLDKSARDALVTRIRWSPQHFVGQTPSGFSSVPTLGDLGLEPRLAVLRTFLVARSDGYAVMPGGLTRVARVPSDPSMSNRAGGLSKDTWVIATEPVREASLLAIEVTDGGPTDRSAALPPAATENLFWMARYAERADQALRLVRVITRVQQATMDTSRPVETRCLETLLRALTAMTGTQPGFLDNTRDSLREPTPELLSVLQHGQRTGSVTFNLHAMLAASHAVRDRLSPDIWRVIGAIRQRLSELPLPLTVEELAGVIDELVTLLAALRGLQEDTMVHSRAWSFLEMGRCVERGLLTTTFLHAILVTPEKAATESRLLDAALEHLESLHAYHREYHHPAQRDSVLRLLLLSESNPRSVGFQLARLEANLATLPDAGAPDELSAEQRLALDARTALRLSEPETLLVDSGTATPGEPLEALLTRTHRLLAKAAQSLANTYFSDPQGPRQLDPMPRPGGERP
ncbi:circularly permuted type 2 ATP-grasp protein [Aquisalimonas sp.]|uniref:circularly permuted type 2 ATP-grasp protein n=1 Tax=Aquisalimonas sp. TaxID=1872621 RepID=UPI0025B805FE|nr:circularly permuted type 2 ATP-grasp protein [Aquisalimonas sp.]